MRPYTSIAAAALGIVLATSPLGAQTPAPAPAAAPTPPPPPPQEGTAEFSYVATTGNASTSALGLAGEYIRRRAPWELKGKAGYVRNESEAELKAEAFTGLLRASRTITERLAMFAEYGFLHDRFAGIESRHTVGGGIAFAVVRPPPHQLHLDAGIGYSHEDRVGGDRISTAVALLGARYKLRLSATAEFTDDLLFNASLSDSDDWRTANVAALTVKIASIFSLKLSNTYRFVNAPADGFQATDTSTSVALVAKF